MFNQFFVNLFSLLIFYKLKGEIHTFAQKCIHFCALLLSPPTRVAWIETPVSPRGIEKFNVATHTGGVDRNHLFPVHLYHLFRSPPTRVAWIETAAGGSGLVPPPSPPTRVAWIETCQRQHAYTPPQSPPTRVAWIETVYRDFRAAYARSRHPHGWRG